MRSSLKCLICLFLVAFLLISDSFLPDSTVILSSTSAPIHVVPQAAQTAVGTWVPAGNLADGRHGHTATLLSDGRILIVGGLQEPTVGSPALASAEIYAPVSGTWSATGSLSSGRIDHTATLLPNGAVLVAGGMDGYAGSTLASVEIYDPVSGIWSSAPSLSVPRRGHSATRLADGRVLVTGGRFSTSPSDVHASAEIFDPLTGSWSSTGSLSTPREGHSATLLIDGRVLVVNGYYLGWLASAEVYDPEIGAWSQIADPLSCHGVVHTATRMSEGQVLVVGGACGSGTPGIRDDAEIYDPAISAWSATSGLPSVREAHTATLLPNGMVLVVGGDNGDAPRYDSALIYDAASGIWSPTASLATGRRSHTATLLPNGTVLVVGGWGDDSTYLQSAELWSRFRMFLPLTFRNSGL